MTRIERWRNIRWIVLLLAVFLGGEVLYFANIHGKEPPRIDDTPEGYVIEFTVDQANVLTLESCVRGTWKAEGASEIRVNGGDWTDQQSGEYMLCNQPDLSPTLEVKLPSSAIASYTLDVKVIFAHGIQALAGLVLILLALWVWGVQMWSHRRLLVLVIGVHIAFVFLYQLTTDLDINNSWRWDTLVHTLKMADLRENLLDSFLYMHSQPPLFSVYGVVMDMLFPANRPQMMYVVQVGLGALMCGMTYVILWRLTGNKTLTWIASLILALNPAYFFFEALILYTLHSAFLILSAGFCLVMYRWKGQNRYLLLFVLCLNLLVLLRSVYHIGLLIPAILLVLILARENWRRVLLGSVLICLLSVGWYGKNLVVFGNFSGSSWMGMSLWKVARYDYADRELQDLLDQDVLTDRTVIWFPPFMNPSAYPSFERQREGIYALSQDNLNNAVYPEINQLYQTNAINLIAHDIGRYLAGAKRAYGYYSCPSSTYELMEKNLATFPASHQAASVDLFHMQGVTLEIARRLGLSTEYYGACSNLYVVIPLVMLTLPLLALVMCRLDWRCWRDLIRRESFLIFAWGMVTYTTLFTSLLEIPENARFKFMIEVPLFILLVSVAYRVIVYFIRSREPDSI